MQMTDDGRDVYVDPVTNIVSEIETITKQSIAPDSNKPNTSTVYKVIEL